MISWETQYELGIKSIDDQHKELVNIINKMAALLIEAKQGVDIYDEVATVINDLKKYTIYHFKYEENLFDQYSYEYKDTHKAEHDKLVSDIEELDLSSFDEDQIKHTNDLLKFLITWLFKHISGSDFLYRDLLKGYNVQ
ncbi:putative Hemerythrin-like protein CA_C0069 [Acetoanaerobium sticklandii]|uniref:Putative Hemerythrin-like protein CA_C0069 n=1 Tax=Acetoanaerobium sticklandii (strain ATCC 12662 / DSM 519 / JCM 1433 / CCUG 9281 / NCIMB 10654 / HF) TaxID=499177 RepID=E3PTF0_ACESD|nr:bacteriohemerythrin [Acetoanaerobium sticklandii]CBH22154.1 putative Hemerythrin-like protein CA_C0069 [Acetoanaerobium sticklandii]